MTIADTLRKKMIDQQICFILWHRISECPLCLKHVTVLMSLQMGKSENHISQKLISDNRNHYSRQKQKRVSVGT